MLPLHSPRKDMFHPTYLTLAKDSLSRSSFYIWFSFGICLFLFSSIPYIFKYYILHLWTNSCKQLKYESLILNSKACKYLGHIPINCSTLSLHIFLKKDLTWSFPFCFGRMVLFSFTIVFVNLHICCLVLFLFQFIYTAITCVLFSIVYQVQPFISNTTEFHFFFNWKEGFFNIWLYLVIFLFKYLLFSLRAILSF